MLEIEIDGKKVELPDGSTVMDGANKLGVYIPHFCYHKKLSIAANCRMCLVQVEKAPKPAPACATPATNGMKVWTHSEQAVTAQKGVMEFLLINHPLDCPICDQGGECQLQDLSMGYGQTASRYTEAKRVVVNKNLGPLISTDMTRCIHCTRCVRFGQEIAGVMELGVANRGERSEILAFVDRTVDSELSGNSIDLCPVGALTSKPFRFSARTWELARRKSVSPHDGLGANLIVQVKHEVVKRVLPLENDGVNECWLADRDRFSYEAINSEQRLAGPKVLGKDVDWQEALEEAVRRLGAIVSKHGPASIGALAAPQATLEELYLLQKLMRGLGSGNVDFRLRQADFALDGKLAGAPWLGTSISDFAGSDRVLVVGSFLRKDHPLLCHRLRQAAKKGTLISAVNSATDDWALPVSNTLLGAPDQLPSLLGEVLKAVHAIVGGKTELALDGPEPSGVAKKIAAEFCAGKKAMLALGNFAQQHPRASALHLIAQEIARLTGARFGYLGEAANSVGGYAASAVPFAGLRGLNARDMVSAKLRAYVLLHADPDADFFDTAAARAALAQADLVVALTPFGDKLAGMRNVIALPIGTFAETSGTFVNTEGRIQSFNAVAKPVGDCRPGWKVIRKLGNLLEVGGFNLDSSEAVRDEALAGRTTDLGARANNKASGVTFEAGVPGSALQRVADVPIYSADPLVRRAPSLQKTRDAATPAARMCSATLAKLGVQCGQPVKVSSGSGSVVLNAMTDEGVAESCVRIAAAREETAALGAMFAEITVERA
ncbi:MAG: NADH-quinone oxidoreductase subunit NuoG [Rhodocyclaceae bacterium]|nr:NADH-quinone oxidoreductase subunit NuoG [Rhodocyclaceae bacterium]